MMEKKDCYNFKQQGLIFKSKLFLKEFFFAGDFFRNKIVIWMLVLSLIINFVNWIILTIFIRKVDSGVILHYNVYFGVDVVGSWKESFIFPLIGLVLFFLNFILAGYFYRKKERIASYLLLIASLMIQCSFIISSVSIIIINY